MGVLSVRDSAENWREGREDRASTCGMKRIVGSWSLAVVGNAGIAGSGSTCCSVDREGVGIVLAFRLRVIASTVPSLVVVGSVESTEVEVFGLGLVVVDV